MFNFDSDTVTIITVLGIIAAYVIGMIAICVSAVKTRKKALDSADEYDEPAPEPLGEYARVVSKRMEEGYGGSSKAPKYHLFFIVTFLTDRGETKEFSVSEETYQRLSEHQAGMLVTVDGNFFDFGDGEEVSDDEQ